MTQLAQDFRKTYQTVSDHAKHNNVTRQAVYRKIKRGTLEVVQVGRTWYIRKEDNE